MKISAELIDHRHFGRIPGQPWMEGFIRYPTGVETRTKTGNSPCQGGRGPCPRGCSRSPRSGWRGWEGLFEGFTRGELIEERK